LISTTAIVARAQDHGIIKGGPADQRGIHLKAGEFIVKIDASS